MALTLNDEQEAQLLDLIGLPAAEPGETNVEDVLDTIADLAEEGTKATASAQAGGETPTGIAAAAKAAGLEVVDPSTLDDLRAQAAEGRRLAAAAAQAKVAASVDDAISRGKIAPSRREHWLTICAADAGMVDVLAGIPDETAVPMTELGHSLEPIAHGSDGAWLY